MPTKHNILVETSPVSLDPFAKTLEPDQTDVALFLQSSFPTIITVLSFQLYQQLTCVSLQPPGKSSAYAEPHNFHIDGKA